MNLPFKRNYYLLALVLLQINLSSHSQQIKDFKAIGPGKTTIAPISHQEQFNGYTRYWHDNYTSWYRYGNLFKLAAPELSKTILQSKLDIAKEIGFPGLLIQEGFVSELLSSGYKTIITPSREELEMELNNGNVLFVSKPGSSLDRELVEKSGIDFRWPIELKSHQYDAVDLNRIRAFYLTNGSSKLFVISSEDISEAKGFLELIEQTREILDKYNLHKGWFGAKSLLKSVTCTPGHPLEIIGKGMNEGCSWFVFDGYMDFMAKDELTQWMKDVDLPVVADAGFAPIYGCDNYDGLQVQDMPSKQAWTDYAKPKGGYVFKTIYEDPDTWEGADFDGYVAIEGNKEQIDKENIPFVLESGFLADNLTSSMMLFIEKSQLLTKESMWEAIMDRREVAILEHAKMMGPAKFRNALQLLYLDRFFLEDYFGDRLDIQVSTEGYHLKVIIRNLMDIPADGTLDVELPKGVSLVEKKILNVNMPAKSHIEFKIELNLTAEAMGYTNPIAVHFNWDNRTKSSLAMLDMPPAISVHKLVYSNSSNVHYPASVHNFSDQDVVEVKLDVFTKDNQNIAVLSKTKQVEILRGQHSEVPFDFPLDEGEYTVKVSALGLSEESQLGVEKDGGKCSLTEVDLNSDGIMEYRIENDSVIVTLLTTGARVIEYIVKSRNDNVLFKIWPEKAPDDHRPFRKRGFYPYGGFEDFLGQGSMETHRIYDAKVVKKEGEYCQVVMNTDYFGNKLQKTFTLYGNSPLLEVRFALDFKNPEANVIGPQPILELGEKHWKEDAFYCLTRTGLQEYRMREEDYYGGIIWLQEGWNAGYDTEADVNFVGAFPVDQPHYLHMWMNHPRNKESHHYYVEFQPWVPIIQKNTFYFSYYLWGSGGSWENGVEELRKRNLVSIHKEKSHE